MRVIQKAHHAGERVIALGTFDGVHKGHRSLIKEAKTLATELGIPLRLCTFNRHPLEIIKPEHSPAMLSTIPEKAREMQGLGVDEMELIPFNRNTADLEPEEFLSRLRYMQTVRGIVAGWNYSFGKKGRGNAEMLLEDGNRHGYQVIIVPPTTMEDGTVISSSLIRKTVTAGQISKAAELLGYDYSITGNLSQQKKADHISDDNRFLFRPWKRKAMPQGGCYVCRVETGSEYISGVINFTSTNGKLSEENEAELFLPDYYGDFSGKKVRIIPDTEADIKDVH